MCGIVGIIGVKPVADRLMEALRRLEYRGYDSAGIATLEGAVISRRRAEGKLFNLQSVLSANPLTGNIGIGHTRWATHGAPNETNAHPHATDRVAVVHNGIIENFLELKADLEKNGYCPQSQTDTEMVALMVSRELDAGKTPEDAVAKVLPQLHGAFGLAFLFADEPELLIAARLGSPLAIGHGADEMFLGSDAFALAPFTNSVTYLEEGDWAVITPKKMSIRDFSGNKVSRERVISSASSALVGKGNYRHFMLKEIHEQPETVSHTVAHYVDMTTQKVSLRETIPFDLSKLSRITLVACGTAYYACNVAKYWFESFAGIPVDIDVASEFRYREPPLEKGGLAMFVSQSGETADTLAALRYCARQGQAIASIVNVTESTIARESDVIFPIQCGPEIGVASTKAFTSQLSALASLVIAVGRARNTLSADKERVLVEALIHLPSAISAALVCEPQIEVLAKRLSRSKNALYLGRGQMFPIALEGALKLKEISYIHAEAYAGGELKHGPIALIDEEMPVIVVAPSDGLMEKTISNMHEVVARGGQIILITDEEGAKIGGMKIEETIIMPQVHEFVAPMIASIAVQLLAYHTAVLMGTDVDQPRNLAKSVTVE